MRSLLAAILLVVLGACSLPQQRTSRAFAPYAPLQAHITSTSSNGPIFHVNRPAYVAMFYIVPGAGVSMLYPGFGSGSLDGRVFAGSHFANSRINNREQYFFAGSNLGQPRFFFLIASDRPLNVKQFGSFGSGLQSRLGVSFRSSSAYSVMENLAELALPSLSDDGSWTTDMYVDWPSVVTREPALGRVLVRCNGYEMYVPVQYLEAVHATICDTRADPKDEQDPEAGDSASVVKPKTREPLPADAAVKKATTGEGTRAPAPADRKALRERISSSSQLDRPVSRRTGMAGRDELGRATTRSGAEARTRTGASAASPSRGAATSATSRGATSSSPRARENPAASPSSGGSVSAPAARPSSSGSGGGSTPAPRARNSDG